MPDGTSRFKARGKDILHFMGTSTFSQYTVVADISVVAVTPKISTDRSCLLGCGITTGYGAAVETAKVEEGSNIAVFGAGCVGLSVMQGAVRNKAGMIIAVDVNDGKEAWARKFGATHFVNPTKLSGKTIQEHLIEMTDGGCDYTFDCTGNVGVMRAALEACHKGWGESIVIGVAAAGQEISTRRKSYLSTGLLLSISDLIVQHSNWSPVVYGRAVLSVVSRVAHNCPVWWTTTWTASSRLTSSSLTVSHCRLSTLPLSR